MVSYVSRQDGESAEEDEVTPSGCTLTPHYLWQHFPTPLATSLKMLSPLHPTRKEFSKDKLQMDAQQQSLPSQPHSQGRGHAHKGKGPMVPPAFSDRKATASSCMTVRCYRKGSSGPVPKQGLKSNEPSGSAAPRAGRTAVLSQVAMNLSRVREIRQCR